MSLLDPWSGEFPDSQLLGTETERQAIACVEQTGKGGLLHNGRGPHHENGHMGNVGTPVMWERCLAGVASGQCV